MPMAHRVACLRDDLVSILSATLIPVLGYYNAYPGFCLRILNALHVLIFYLLQVFFIFLYQLYLYPVDKKRANEYGFAYEPDTDELDEPDKPLLAVKDIKKNE